jgi:hypothetical protein
MLSMAIFQSGVQGSIINVPSERRGTATFSTLLLQKHFDRSGVEETNARLVK